MRTRVPIILGGIALAFTACDVNSPHSPVDEAVAVAAIRQAQSSNCPAGEVCRPAQELGPVTASLDSIGASCAQEACGPHTPASPLSIAQDVNGTFYDLITYQCSDSIRTVLSNEGCWDCRGNCGAITNCPAGSHCESVTIPGLQASDCRAYACSDGWEFYVSGTFQVPQCEHLASSLPGAPATTASIVNGHVHLTWSAVSGATSYRVYRQLDWQPAPESWYTTTSTSYTDGTTQVTGVLPGQPASGKWVSYHVVSVNGPYESGYTTKHYFSYTGIAPY